MYKRLTRIFSAIMLAFLLAASAMAAPENYNRNTPAILNPDHLYGEAAVIIDGNTAEVLFSKNSRIRMYPASTTKIMTALLAVESGWSFDTVVTVPPEAADIALDSSIAGIYPGDKVTFGDLLYGMMLPSGNDAANAVAVLVGGSTTNFVQMMNNRAAELGCTGTHFANAHGYHDENHYSTALDLALIAREALKHTAIREITSTSSYAINVADRGEILINNSNVMLNSGSSYYYEECIGLKTGTHSRAGNCFVGAAEKDGVTLITVTLNCIDKISMWTDTIRLYNYGFTCYTPYSLEQMFDLTYTRIVTTRVSNAHEDDEMGGLLQLKLAQVSNVGYERMVYTNSDTAMDTALDDFVDRSQIMLVDNLTAPISAGEIVGSFSYTAQDGEVISATLIAGRDIAAQPERITLYDVFPFLRAFENPLVTLLLVVMILLVVVLLLYSNAKRRRRERRRREVYEQRRREYIRQQRESESYRRSRPRYSGERRRSTAPRRSAQSPQRSARRNHPDDDLFGNF